MCCCVLLLLAFDRVRLIHQFGVIRLTEHPCFEYFVAVDAVCVCVHADMLCVHCKFEMTSG